MPAGAPAWARATASPHDRQRVQFVDLGAAIARPPRLRHRAHRSGRRAATRAHWCNSGLCRPRDPAGRETACARARAAAVARRASGRASDASSSSASTALAPVAGSASGNSVAGKTRERPGRSRRVGDDIVIGGRARGDVAQSSDHRRVRGEFRPARQADRHASQIIPPGVAAPSGYLRATTTLTLEVVDSRPR